MELSASRGSAASYNPNKVGDLDWEAETRAKLLEVLMYLPIPQRGTTVADPSRLQSHVRSKHVKEDANAQVSSGLKAAAATEVAV